MQLADISRFVSKVDVSGDCWLWTAGTFSHGYGEFLYNKRLIGAHRFSWILAHGEFDRSLFVCHKCDNPPCVRPSHLFLGTNRDNMLDARNKGRAVNPPITGNGLYGENHPMAKLTYLQVAQIREDIKNGIKQRDIAKMYSVAPSVICNIGKGKRWRQ